MSSNGPGDNYDLKNSHVIPALIRKFHEAVVNDKKEVILWGSGLPKREFLFVDDLAKAIVFILENNNNEAVYNIGSGTELRIKELAKLIKEITGFRGKIKWDTSKPDGTPRKLLDSTKILKYKLQLKSNFIDSINLTYKDFKNYQSYCTK